MTREAPGLAMDLPGGFSRQYRIAPFLLLATALGVALLAGSTPTAPHWWRLGALAGSAAAALWTVVLLPGTPSQRRLAVYFVVRLALTAFLVVMNPWFGIYAWLAYVEAIGFFGRLGSLLAIFGTALLGAASYLGGFPRTLGGWLLYAVLVGFSTALVASIGWAVRRTQGQQAERDRMMVELVEANRRLADALGENRALHDRVVAQAREAGIRDERARLAGEIHDTLAQSLTGIVTQLQAADGAGELYRVNGGGVRHVEAALGLARTGLAEARRSLQALRPGPLAISRLPEALRRTTEEWTALHDIPVTLEVTGSAEPLEADREIALLRTVQEALANAAKHGAPSQVWVTLSYLDGEVLVDIRDDGSGFTPGGPAARPPGHGLGLAAMVERLARVGGHAAVETEPGCGTTVTATVPAPQARA